MDVESIQLVAVIVVVLMIVISSTDMAMNGARHASPVWVVVMIVAGVVWLVLEWMK